MPQARTVLEHLLDGREALVLEVQRLTTAITELDTVIGRLGGTSLGTGAGNALAASARPVTVGSGVDPVNPSGEVEARPRKAAPSRARSARARKSTPRKAAAKPAETPKSIRVHVLDMLAAEDREFGLAEIIDRIHDEGIQAHDDAVRSITIKLMKDGKVQRVGRGQYRLARRGAGANASAVDTEPAAIEADAEPAAENYTPPLNLGEPWESPAN